MIFKKSIKSRISLLLNPKEGYAFYEKISFEDSVSEYLKFLIVVSIIAGISTFIWKLLITSYFHIFFNADVNYANVINYSLGQASGVLLFYFFAGTFILFLISLILNPFISIKYVILLNTLFLSLTPILMFGWIIQLLPGLIVWCLLLFIYGVRIQKNKANPDKHSIEQRD